MDDTELLIERVRTVMANTFGVDEDEIVDDTSQQTFARWTSVFHMILLVALEEEFGTTFSMDEMTSMTSLRQIMSVLTQRERLAA